MQLGSCCLQQQAIIYTRHTRHTCHTRHTRHILHHPPARSPYTRLVPRVSNLTVRGTLHIALAPLVPALPGFGALMVSLVRTPQVRC